MDGQFPDNVEDKISILRFRRRKQLPGLEGPHVDSTWDYRFIVPFDDCQLMTTPSSALGTLDQHDISVGDVVTLNNSVKENKKPLHVLSPVGSKMDMAVMGRTIT